MKRLALICSLLFSVAYAQTFEYGYIFETSKPLNPAKTMISYRLDDSKSYIQEDSTGAKFDGLMHALNYFGAQGWRVISVYHNPIQANRMTAYLIERETEPLMNP